MVETVLHLSELRTVTIYGSVTSFSLTVLSKGIIPVYSKDSIEIGWLQLLVLKKHTCTLLSSADFSTFDDKERMKHRVQTVASCLNSGKESSNLVSGIYN